MKNSYTIRLDIGPEVIAAGRRRDSRCCPIALAVKRQTKAAYVQVTRRGISAVDEADREFSVDFPVGSLGYEWVKAFDRGEEIGPIDLEVTFKRVA